MHLYVYVCIRVALYYTCPPPPVCPHSTAVPSIVATSQPSLEAGSAERSASLPHQALITRGKYGFVVVLVTVYIIFACVCMCLCACVLVCVHVCMVLSVMLLFISLLN